MHTVVVSLFSGKKINSFHNMLIFFFYLLFMFVVILTEFVYLESNYQIARTRKGLVLKWKFTMVIKFEKAIKKIE